MKKLILSIFASIALFAAPLVADRYIVHGAGTLKQEDIAQNSHGKIVKEIAELNAFVVEVEDFSKIDHTNIKFVEPDFVGYGFLTPNDPLVGSQWHLSNVNAFKAWDYTLGSASVIIGNVDSGVRVNHPDLVGKIILGRDYVNDDDDPSDDHGHGTATVGTSAAQGNNSIGVAGVAMNNKVFVVKVLSASNYGYYSDFAQGIIDAVNAGAKVINCSFGGKSYSLTMQNAVDYAWNRGVIVVAAAGNDGNNIPNYPAALAHVISVSATDFSNNIVSWSSYGDSVDISAPGVSILTTYINGDYASWSGTSFSAPIVSGTIALIWSANPNLTRDQVIDILFSTSDDLGQVGWDQYYGHGKVNVGDAVELALNTDPGGDTPPPPPPPPTPDTTPPEVVILSPDSGYVYEKGKPTIEIAAIASDNVGISVIEIFIDGEKVYSEQSDSISFVINVKKFQKGSHTIRVDAYDIQNNSGSSQVIFTIN